MFGAADHYYDECLNKAEALIARLQGRADMNERTGTAKGVDMGASMACQARHAAYLTAISDVKAIFGIK